jgi:hypothetical protein
VLIDARAEKARRGRAEKRESAEVRRPCATHGSKLVCARPTMSSACTAHWEHSNPSSLPLSDAAV